MSFFSYTDSTDLTPDEFADSICLYLVTGQESENQDMQRLDSFMSTLAKIGKIACQKVVFGFGGYDNDPREVYVIDGARKIMEELLHKHPYFGYFVNPDSKALFVCLLPINDIKNNTVKREDAVKIFNQIKDGIWTYGNQIHDSGGTKKAIKRWQSICGF